MKPWVHRKVESPWRHHTTVQHAALHYITLHYTTRHLCHHIPNLGFDSAAIV